jgi:Domain of unknown function (DUF4105)
MKSLFLSICFLWYLSESNSISQGGNDTLIYLITCGPGTETYSVYGHSAIRIVTTGNKNDNVYNWGLFDFETPNFAWKFAKGRLDYMLGVETMQSFLQVYYFEKRFVLSQKMNLDSPEKRRLTALINENLRPENIKYRYDFFYDDCSTRIRDLIEKSVGERLLYPPAGKGNSPTFRQMVEKYQDPFPWLNMGINLIMGAPADKRASFRDRMFLPLDMQRELSEAVISRDGKMIPLLQNPETILDFEPPVIKQKFLFRPVIDFSVLLIVVIILSASVTGMRFNRILDLILFSVFTILAILMVFFNFFTDHQQMKWNLNIIWLNPFIAVCLINLILNRKGAGWFSLLFFISVAFLVLQFFLPQSFSLAFMPLIAILAIRSFLRADFEWSPLQAR